MSKQTLSAALIFCGFVLINHASADLVQFLSNSSSATYGYEYIPTSLGYSDGYTEQTTQSVNSAPSNQADWSSYFYGGGAGTSVSSMSIAATAASIYSPQPSSVGNFYGLYPYGYGSASIIFMGHD
jgi:hypothetical protein